MQISTTLTAAETTRFDFELADSTNPLEHIPTAFRDMEGVAPCLSSSFTCGGLTYEVETCREPGESNADFVNRHYQAVRDKIADCC